MPAIALDQASFRIPALGSGRAGCESRLFTWLNLAGVVMVRMVGLMARKRFLLASDVVAAML